MSKENNTKSSMRSRMDHRTKSEFASDIKTYTSIEGFVMRKWVLEMQHIGRPVYYWDVGIDNQGGVIEGCVGVNVDYGVSSINDKTSILVDVKHNYNDATATFKRHNLDAYIKNDIWMLLVLGTGLNGRNVSKEDYEKTWVKSIDRRVWTLMDPPSMQKIIDEVPCTKLKYMGNKPGHIVYRRQFEQYFEFEKFQK